MIVRNERIAGGTAAGRLYVGVRAAGMSLASEILVGSPLVASIGLISIALAFQTIVLDSPAHFRPSGIGAFAALATLGTLASLVASFVATLPLRRLLSIRIRQYLGVAAVLALTFLALFGLYRGFEGVRAVVGGSTYSNDGAVMDLYAADQLLARHNPYLKANIVPALAEMNAPSTTTTPLMDGQFRGAQAYPSPQAIQQAFLNVLLHRPRTIPPEFESKYNYPTGSFLFILPFVWLGFHDLRFVYVLVMLLIGAYLAWRMPRSLRWLAPFVLFANVPLVVLTLGGQPDPVYGLFLIIGLAEWRRRWASPLMLGIAVATKQLAWFFVPLYLLYIARQLGWQEAGRRAAIIAGVFLVTNGPFILQAPGAYISSISGPMIDPMFPLGIGFIALFVSYVLPMLPKLAFTFFELTAWAAGAYAVWRWRLVTLASCAALGALPLFFAWRSLVNYFYLVPIIALAVVLVELRSTDIQTSTVA